jgi:hypothetical protein
MNKNALHAAIQLHNKTIRAMHTANNSQKVSMAMEIARMNGKLLTALAEIVELMDVLKVENITTLQALCIQGGAMAGMIRKVNDGVEGKFLVPDFDLVTPPTWENFKNELAVVMKTIIAMQPHHDKIAEAVNDNDTSERVHKTGGMDDEGNTNG